MLHCVETVHIATSLTKKHNVTISKQIVNVSLSLPEALELTSEWDCICKCLKDASVETRGFCSKQHERWFDDNDCYKRRMRLMPQDYKTQTLLTSTRNGKSVIHMPRRT